jgi:hypothetical protein
LGPAILSHARLSVQRIRRKSRDAVRMAADLREAVAPGAHARKSGERVARARFRHPNARHLLAQGGE